ncbi:MAG: MerR family transcriptional regulator [Gammaproteobacteria bacterium 28-57-27]|nr:MAG: MerR family transcriptional regulator [Gammaproteobacteria bacterium 28-57-27]
MNPPKTPESSEELPEIPNKRYFTIGEASELCAVKSHVLRYWEQEFIQLAPVKRRGNRRYYQREDIELIRHIRGLLYGQGFTISGARQQLETTLNGAPQSVSIQDITQQIQSIVISLREGIKHIDRADSGR